MQQKTYRIADFSGGFEAALAEAAALPAYQNAAQVLLTVYEQNWDLAVLERKLHLIRETLPKAEIAGTTHYDDLPSFAGKAEECSLLSFLFFEKPGFSLLRLSAEGKTDAALGAELNRAIRAHPDCKGVHVYFAQFARNLDTVLAEAGAGVEDVPIFGGTASLSADIKNYVFDADGVYRDTLLAVLYHGPDVHVRASYNYGWTPVGKPMTVTGTEGDFCVAEIDGRPAAEIYRRYLGLTPALILIPNICEFPLILDRGGLTVARVPMRCEKGGRLRFGAAVREGEEIRFSYGAQQRIFSDVYEDAAGFLDVAPQAMFLTVCMNRLIFLKDEEHREVDCYRRIAPELAILHGNSEFYRCGGAGGELNSALVAVGLWEGTPEKREITLATNSFLADRASSNFTIPLEFRVMTFMSAVTADLQKMTERANAASEAKSAFLSSMSHEIRTPINAVLGMDEMILREATEASILEYAENIRTAGGSLLGLINDILDFSKIEAGKMDILPVEYETASMLNDLVNLIRKRAEDKGLTLSVEADRSLPAKLYGDELRLKQVITNILTNAVKYTERGGATLRVYAEPSETAGNIVLCVSVKDTGIGIKEEDMQKLFSAFERIEEERNRGVEGTGLGMSITQRLLAMMDSKLEVQSVYGEGSEFSFRVEQKIVDAAPMGDFNERLRQSLAARGRYRESFRAPEARILAVDDTPINLTVFKGLLKKTAVRIDTAESGAECLALLTKNKYDVIFLDHRMPEMDGVETRRRMDTLPGNLNRGTPVIALTANAVSGAREEYLALGFEGYLAKPIDTSELEALMVRFLPPEKVLPPAEDGALAEAPRADLPEWLRGIAGLDLPLGLKHCGTEETYLETLTIYARNAAAYAEEIEAYRRANDLANVVTKVHALKSTSRAIGAEALGALAEKLELAGKAGDARTTLGAELDGLLERFRALGKRLAPLIAPEAEADNALPLIPEEKLREAYDSLREFSASLDSDGAAFVLHYLDGFRIPEAERDRVERLRAAIAGFDWELIPEILE